MTQTNTNRTSSYLRRKRQHRSWMMITFLSLIVVMFLLYLIRNI